MTTPPAARSRYDVLIAGARCAGASTALLLARRGLRVLVVDPLKRGSDTLSTHALMRGGVLQLSRWRLLDDIRSAGTPPVRTTWFHYGEESIEIPIQSRDGIDALYAPRRTLLDRVLVEAAEEAGADVLHGFSIAELVHDADGRVRGAGLAGQDQRRTEIEADLVIGADGARSRVARLVGARIEYALHHGCTTIYGYWRGLPNTGYHWFYDAGASVGLIPTNEGDTCVFAAMPNGLLNRGAPATLETLHRDAISKQFPSLARLISEGERSSRLRAFAGMKGFLRQSVGPGWALVGDAGYFRDPITAHGITDALRDAELLAISASAGDEESFARYQDTRDALVRRLLEISDRLASFDWDLEEAKELHRALSREMKAEVESILALDGNASAATSATSSPEARTRSVRSASDRG